MSPKTTAPVEFEPAFIDGLKTIFEEKIVIGTV
jgi:hypothetical protein